MWKLWGVLTAAAWLAQGVLADEILRTSGFANCVDNAIITVDTVDIQYNNENSTVIFDISGTSTRDQNVTAWLNVTAYGTPVFDQEFDPCDPGTRVDQLCPIPEGDFSAWGSQRIPSQFLEVVPDIAFKVPDISAQATLRLMSQDTNEDVACIQSQVSNGKTADVPQVSYVAAGIAGAALVMSGVSALGSAVAGGGAMAGGGGGGAGGSGTVSPGFTEVAGWFQGLAMDGMLSVNYPPIYRSFTKNFAFSTGLVPWRPLQSKIDDFREMTGGNLTNDSIEFLNNATLVFPDGTTKTADQGFFKAKRALEAFEILAKRQFLTGQESNPDDPDASDFQSTVTGIQAFANQLRVPESDMFLTVLLVVAIVIAAIVLFILLFKLILETWAIWGKYPDALAGFRKHYWGSIARAVTALIFLLYGIWVLYCVFQFTRGDSWAATALAAVSLAIFTGVLAFFSWKIWSTAKKLKETEGVTDGLYENKSIWVKYSLFYDSYRKQYWWLFLPLILYMAIKGCVIAAGDGFGRAQSIALLAVESVMLVLLLWIRPFERKSGNVVNILIQVVRVLSVVCIMVFVEEFGIQQTTQTVTGVVLIAIQSALTILLVVLILWHAFEACCRANPHRQRRKDMGKSKLIFNREIYHLHAINGCNLLTVFFPNYRKNATAER